MPRERSQVAPQWERRSGVANPEFRAEPTQLTPYLVADEPASTTCNSRFGKPKKDISVEKIVVDSKLLRSRMWEKVVESGNQ